jgi:glycosyltransferase involved in cell wall biosynthesis
VKVLIDGRPIRRPISGVAQYTCSLAAELATRGEFDLRVLTLEFGAAGPHTEFSLGGAPLRHISRVPRKAFNVGVEHLGLPLANWWCGDIDLVHLTFFGWLPTQPRARVVSTIHDLIPLEQPEIFTRNNAYYSKLNFWRQVDESDAIIAVSEFTRRKILEHAGSRCRCPVHVVPNGIRALDTLVSADIDLAARYGINRPFVLYVGNIEPRKGVPALIQAFRRSRHAADLQLVIAGKKCWGYETIEALAREGGGDIIFPGYISEVEKAVLLKAATVFVYPSTYEGFGIPVIEAMNCGCPVITADNSSLPEVCGDAGLLFATGSVEDLAAKLDLMLSSADLRRTYAARGRERAAKYTWRSAAAQTAAIYRSLA